jgi:ketosteroid isomerase-like protein
MDSAIAVVHRESSLNSHARQACFVCLMSYMPFVFSEAKRAPDEQEIIDVSAARREATNRREMEAAAAYVAKDCLFSTEYGALISKDEYIERRRKMPAAYDQTTNPRQYVVRRYGNTAVLSFLVTDLEQYGDQTIVNEQRRTETWHRQAGRWLLIAAQWDNTPVNFRKPVLVDNSRFKDYVGRYLWRAGDVIDTVSEKAGRLWSRFGDDSTDLDEYFPAGDETFFVREGDLGTITFQRDAARRVVGYTSHRVDGQDIFVRKLR